MEPTEVNRMVAKAMIDQIPPVAAYEASQEVTRRDRERQRLEDKRANHRNLNRMLTLLGALVIGLVVTFTLQNGMWGAMSKPLAPYSFTITILMDSSLAAYSFVRKY